MKGLQEHGFARRLAEPNLLAYSGDTASFLAGGEFPFPVRDKDDKITVEFQKFGVNLAFTPTVLSEERINLKIEPEVSEVAPDNGIRFRKFRNIEIPSLIVRRASTTAELRTGQSFAIGSLWMNNQIKHQRQLPWLFHVPVVGTLMSSTAWQKNETDLIVIVKPRLVQPRAQHQRSGDTTIDGPVREEMKDDFN